MIEPGETALEVAQHETRGRQHAPIILGILMNDLPLPLPAQTREVADVDRIAASFVIQIAENRLEKFAARIVVNRLIQLAGRRQIKGAVHGKIPACAANTLGLLGETGAISAILRPPKLVFSAFDNFLFAFDQ